MTMMEFWYFLYLVVALIGYVPMIVIMIAIFVKYPVRTFMKAKALGLNPLPNRRLEIVALSDDKELAKTSDGSFVFTQPDHYFIESKTRKPAVLMDSRVGQTISLDGYRLMNLLKENGYENYDQLIAAVKKDPDAEIEVPGRFRTNKVSVTKAMIDELKGDAKAGAEIVVEGVPIKLTKQMIEAIEKHGEAIINIKGESLPLSNAVDFFSQTIPGTVIETMLQYRSTVEALRQKKKDLMQWIVILGFFVICIGFAVLLISHAAPPMANVAANMADTGAKVAGTGIK